MVQLKFQLAGDLTATVAILTTDGQLEVISGVPVREAKAFQELVDSLPKKTASEKIHSQPLDPAENEPGPPLAQNPCGQCGLVHPSTGNITCVCQFCGEIRELVHSGACDGCCKHRFGHYFSQLGTPLGDTGPTKPPWAN